MPMVVGAAAHASIGISDSGAASICVLTRNEVRQLVKQRHSAFHPMPSRSRCLSEEDVCGRLQSLVSQTSIKDYVGEPPPIAFPTVAIAVVCVLSYVTTVYQAFTGALSLPIATALCSFIAYIAFTPMHDACHGSVAADPSFRFINNVVGTACGALFPLPFAAFKRMHLLHHKHTNDEHMDPDVWTSKGPLLLLPLRWVSIEASYYTAYIPDVLAGRRPRSEALQSSRTPTYRACSYLILPLFCALFALHSLTRRCAVAALLLIISAAIYCSCCSSSAVACTAFWCWFVSGRLALMFLAFSFDYLPHRPHTATRARNPIKATSVTSLFTRTDAWLLTLPLLHQNYHNIHHIWPYIPFYKYSQAWAAMSTSLLELGTEVAPILSFKSHPLLQQADE